MNQLHEESDKSHNQKSNTCRTSDLSKFFPVGFGAFLDEVDGVLGELTEGLDEDFVEAFFF